MKSTLLSVLLLAILFCPACKSEDDEEMITTPLESCCDIAALNETVDGRGIYIPNVFTPNADGINDFLSVHTY